ncbi:MAG: hypothetical protein AAF990_13555 [Bacteroidota bacterium]
MATEKAPDVPITSFYKNDLIQLYPLNTTKSDWSITAKLIDYQNDSLTLEIHQGLQIENPNDEVYQASNASYFRRNQAPSVVYAADDRPLQQLALKDFYYIQKARRAKFRDNNVFVTGVAIMASGVAMLWAGAVGEARNNGLDNLKIPGYLGVGLGLGVVAISLPISLGGRKYSLNKKVESSTLFLPMD